VVFLRAEVYATSGHSAKADQEGRGIGRAKPYQSRSWLWAQLARGRVTTVREVQDQMSAT
jgi:hypothetical protein